MLTINKFDGNDLGANNQKEWLITNGIGGYASSTVSGANSRRYHGLLVASTHPPVGRLVMLSKLEDAVVIDGSESIFRQMSMAKAWFIAQAWSVAELLRLAKLVSHGTQETPTRQPDTAQLAAVAD